MNISKSFTGNDKRLQLVNTDVRPLTLIDKIKGKSEEMDNLEDVIDLDRELQKYEKDTLRKIKPQQI